MDGGRQRKNRFGSRLHSAGRIGNACKRLSPFCREKPLNALSEIDFSKADAFCPNGSTEGGWEEAFTKSQDHFNGLGFTDGRNTQRARERPWGHWNSNRGRRLCGNHGRGFLPGKIAALQILRPESAGFPQNLERMAGEVAFPSASLSKRLFGKVKKPRPFQRSWL